MKKNMNELFKKAADIDELPQGSGFDKDAFWNQLQHNLDKPKAKKNVWYYYAAAAVATAAVILLFLTFDLKLDNDKTTVAPLAVKLEKMQRKISNRSDTKMLVMNRLIKVQPAITHQSRKNEIVKTDSNQIVESNKVEIVASVEPMPALVPTSEKITENTPLIAEVQIQNKTKQKARKPLKLRIVHANELGEVYEQIAIKTEPEKTQPFISINFNFKQQSEASERNLISLIRKK